MTDTKELEKLLEKYLLNTCTRAEMDRLLDIIRHEQQDNDIARFLKAHWAGTSVQKNNPKLNVEEKFYKLMKTAEIELLDFVKPEVSRRARYIRLAAAAVTVALLSAAIYFLLKPASQQQIAKTGKDIQDKNRNDAAPGKNTAVLTLADGSTVSLDEVQNGTVSTQGNTKVLKLNNGMLSYNTQNNKASEILYNTVATPRGGQYQLVLSDGTKVWLNAASSLKFPTAFTGKERKVELLGEAYFEVTKNEAMPFKVEAQGMEVEVLGTHFNINSYDNETSSRTTLLEGSVKINHDGTANFLKPGQQAKLNRDGEIKIVNDANIDEAIAWKEGRFQFDRADIHDVMRQIARWYDVRIDYKGIITSHFGGSISRNVNLSQVLKMLELTGELKFQIDDGHVIVMP